MGMIRKEVSLQVLHQISNCDVVLLDNGCVLVLGLIREVFCLSYLCFFLIIIHLD